MKTVESKQIGFKFEGADVVTANYSKTHYFPAGVSTSKEIRHSGWDTTEAESKPDRTYDIIGRVGDRWNAEYYKSEYKVPPTFEVLVIERIDGRIVKTTVGKAVPWIDDVEVECADEVDDIPDGVEAL